MSGPPISFSANVNTSGGFNQPPQQQNQGFNQPPQQQGFNQPPQQQGFNQPPQQQGFSANVNTSGGFNQPPQQQGNVTMQINSTGGFNQPPQQQNQFNQPPQQQAGINMQVNTSGGFNQPPQQQGPTQVHVGGVMHQTNALKSGEFISSPSNQYHLYLQHDGNLVLYSDKSFQPQYIVWSTATGNKGQAPYSAVLQVDGQFTLYDITNTTIWSSNTQNVGQAPYKLVVQEDRNICLYDRNNQVTYQTNTTVQQQSQGFNQPPQQQQTSGFNYPEQQQQGFNQPPPENAQINVNLGGFGFNMTSTSTNSSQQGQFNQPPQQQQGFNQPPQQQQGFNQPPQQQQGFNQPPQQQGNINMQVNTSGGFNQPPQQQGQSFQPSNQNIIVSSNGQNQWLNEKLPMMIKRSKPVGNVAFNSHCFDDFFGLKLNKEFHTPELEEITVYYTNQFVVGIESKFKCMGKNNGIPGVPNKHYNGFDVQKTTIKLGFSEHIDEISGRSGSGIERLFIKTSKNQTIDVGGNGGQPFKNILPFGIHTGVAFGGSYNTQFLESLYLIYK